MALSRERRLNKKDFSLVFKKGKLVPGEALIAKVVKTDAKKSRFGFAISTKVAAKAAERNRLKRFLTEEIRKKKELERGWDIVLVLKDKKEEHIKEGLRAILNKIK